MTISMTNRKGVPGARRAGPGRQWYQGYADPTGPEAVQGSIDCGDAREGAYMDPAWAPPNSGLLPGSRAELVPQADPVEQARAGLTSVINTPPAEWISVLRPVVGGAALMAKDVPFLLRVAVAIWGLYPIYQRLRP